MVNLYMVGQPNSSDWVLIDAGLPGFGHSIIAAADQRFGSSAPRAIILTHGHFDHVGSLRPLLEHWICPVYAHPLEMPYIAGRASYPPPDPTVGGGLMARLSPFYPRRGANLGHHIQPLPSDGSVPHMPGWQWIHTPGHSPGHVSFFRPSDRTLIAGDAFTTQKQESLLSVLTHHQHIHGPPMYFTCDWQAARRSVAALASLEPEIGATGHGIPMRGPDLRENLHRLADHFDELAMPRHSRYVQRPAIADQDGVVYVPPRPPDHLPSILAAGALGFGIGAAIASSPSRACE